MNNLIFVGYKVYFSGDEVHPRFSNLQEARKYAIAYSRKNKDQFVGISEEYNNFNGRTQSTGIVVYLNGTKYWRE